MGPRPARALTAALLVCPAVLAFFAGGYFDVARGTAALVAWAFVVAAAVVAPWPVPRSRAAWATLAGLALLAALELGSITWAPLRGRAVDDAVRSTLYLGALLAALALLRERAAARLAEPVLLAGVVVVLGYGLSERLLPGVVELARSTSAFGRLEQPLSYWNAMGALGTTGLLLSLRMAGDGSRDRRLAAAAGAAAPLLGAGILLSFSRGALLALAGGVVVLAVLGDARQARALVAGLVLAALAGAAAAALPAVGSLSGSDGARQGQGALLLGWLLLLGVAGAVLAARSPRAEAPRRRRRGLAVAALAATVVALVVAGAAVDGGPGGDPADGATAARLASTGSNRYEYWQVALGAFADHPLRGVGSGGFAQAWLRERTIPDQAQDAHSLPIEVAAELGLAGLLALGLLAAGLLAGVRGALRRDRVLALGPAAVLAAAALHACLDWDWEMPALTLVALGLAGLALAVGEEARPGRGGAVPRTALVLLALLLAVPLGIALRGAVLSDRGFGLVFRPTGPRATAFERTRDVLRRARQLNPDTFPDLLDAQLELRVGRVAQARATVERVVAQEPENGLAWRRLAVITREIDPARSAEAARRARELAPPIPGAR